MLGSNFEVYAIAIPFKNTKAIVVFLSNKEDSIYLYNIKNGNKNIETLRRKVIVIDNEENNEFKPQIKLNGDEIIYLNKGDTYQELGALATDKIDGDISNKVIINSNINSNVVGEYEVKYTVTNSKGYSSIIVRKVIVGEQKDDKELVVNPFTIPSILPVIWFLIELISISLSLKFLNILVIKSLTFVKKTGACPIKSLSCETNSGTTNTSNNTKTKIKDK